MSADYQQHSARRDPSAPADPGAAEGGAENSEPAPRLQRGRREIRPMGCKNQQSFLRFLHHHRLSVSSPHLY